MAAITLNNVISESGRRTGIGAAAEPLTRDLLRLMTSGAGGLSGFLDRFRSAGFGTEIASFLSGRSDAPLPPTAVDKVIGESAVANMAQRAGVAPAAASTAIGYELPKLIDMLTPGGQVPAVLPSEIQTFVGQGEQAAPIGMATVRQEEQVRPVAMATVADRRNLNWLWALLALAVLAGLLWMLLSRNNQPVTPPTAQVTPPAASVPAPPTPAPTAPPAAVASTVDALNQQLSGKVLNFANGSAVLPAESAQSLQQAADLIKGLPAGTVIQIGGHTDNSGDPAANQALSQQRAEAVRDALVRDGVDSSRLVAMGFGDTQPIASNDTPEGRLQNRRTEFSVASTTQTTTAPAAPGAAAPGAPAPGAPGNP